MRPDKDPQVDKAATAYGLAHSLLFRYGLNKKRISALSSRQAGSELASEPYHVLAVAQAWYNKEIKYLPWQVDKAAAAPSRGLVQMLLRTRDSSKSKQLEIVLYFLF